MVGKFVCFQRLLQRLLRRFVTMLLLVYVICGSVATFASDESVFSSDACQFLHGLEHPNELDQPESQRERELKWVQQFIAAGKDFNQSIICAPGQVEGFSLYQAALHYHRYGLVAALLEAGADPNQAFQTGIASSPLLEVSQSEEGTLSWTRARTQRGLLELLLAHGAEVDRQYGARHDSEHCQAVIPELLQLIGRLEASSPNESAPAHLYPVLDLLLRHSRAHGKPLCAAGTFRGTALQFAKLYGSDELCRIVSRYDKTEICRGLNI